MINKAAFGLKDEEYKKEDMPGGTSSDGIDGV